MLVSRLISRYHCNRLQSVGPGGCWCRWPESIPLGSTVPVGKSATTGLNSARAQEVKQVGSVARRGVSFFILFRGKEGKGGAFLTQQRRIYMFSTVPTPELGQLLKNSREIYVILITNSTFWLLSTPTVAKDKNQSCLLNFFNDEKWYEDHLRF